MTYIPPQFQVPDAATVHEFMRTYDFATIVSHAPDGFVTSHVPVLVRLAGPLPVIAGHMARANSHWRLMNGTTPALAVFHGPHGYVSPTWYTAGPAVPTWNYGVVHAHGLPTVNEDQGFVRGVLEELIERYEGRRANRWQLKSVPAEFYQRMLGGIVGFEMPATRLEGKFKLGQNRSAEDRRGTIAGLEREGSGTASALAEFMRRYAGAIAGDGDPPAR